MNSQPARDAAVQNDFPDWLSPILVKELRQGLRTKVFTITFLVLQVLLIGCVLIGLLVAAHGGNTSASSGFFWSLVGLPMLMVLPWSGLNAISAEVRANTLDLIFLTRLSAWRILVGKWIAIVAQSALLLAAVLPYVVLRYFMGGVDLASELLVVALMMTASAILSAMLVGLSAYPGRLMRVGVIIALFFGFQMSLWIMAIFAFSPTSPFGGAGMGKVGVFAIIAITILLAMLLLEFGAARIAPVAENHALRKRILGFLILLVAAFARTLDPHTELVALFAFIVTIPLMVGAMCEEMTPLPAIYRPFARKGLPGRLVGRFLYPGWPSGMLYCVLLLGGFAGLFHSFRSSGQWWFLMTCLAFCGALFTPVALIRLAMPAGRRALVLFIVFQLSAAFLEVAVRIVDQVTDQAISVWLAFIPTAALIAIGTNGIHEPSGQVVTWITGGVLAASLLVLVILNARPFRQIAALERESLAEPVRHDGVA
jgi:hypothetical protein